MKLYYCKCNNFGDSLNEYIFKRCFNINIEYSDTFQCNAIGIGSILDNMLIQTKDWNRIFRLITNKNPVFCFSSGFGWENEHYLKKIRFLYNMKFKRKIEFISLRGQLTLNSVEKIIGEKLDNVILGDLGLLVSYLIKESKDKTYDLGIIPHYADAQSPVFESITKRIPNSVILDTRENPVDFLNKLNKCRTIISTGLHPLIAADSLGIPNLWCRISEKTTTRHKYRDYYSVYNLQIEPTNLLNNTVTPDFIKENYKVSPDIVENMKENLYIQHNNFFKDNAFKLF